MSGFKVPLSSSPQAQSTPGSNPRRVGNYNSSSFFPSNPSTTPAGPPPSSVGSFTPADPPPSSIFGSSQLGPGKTLFKTNGTSSGSNNKSQRGTAPSADKIGSGNFAQYLEQSGRSDVSKGNGAPARNSFDVPSSSPPQAYTAEYEQYGDEPGEPKEASEDDELREQSEDSDTDNMILRPDMVVPSHSFDPGSTMNTIPNGSLASADRSPYYASTTAATSRGVKRSRGGAMIHHESLRNSKRPARPKKDSPIPSLAENMVATLGVANLDEHDDMIVGTEELIAALYAAEDDSAEQPSALQAALPGVSERLCNLWKSCRDKDLASFPPDRDVIIGIGPDEKAPLVHTATFLCTLLLPLHHPPEAKGKQALAVSRFEQPLAPSSSSYSPEAPLNPTAYPRILLDWLENSHNPYRSSFADVQSYHPNLTAHYNFWDIIFVLTVRGKIAEVAHILRKSDFQYARTARDDGLGDAGYQGTQAKNIERVVNRAIQVLEVCPILQDEDWNVAGKEWKIFRKRVEQAMNDLATFAEGRDRDLDPEESTFEASRFGLGRTNMSLSQSARRAESRVPWTIYQHLKTMYGILLGGNAEILSSAQDWVEATIGLTAWWGGEDDEEVAVGSVALTRRSLRQSQSRAPRLVDVDATLAYLRRMAYAFERVTDDSEDDLFLPNPNKPVEVALASIFEGNVGGVIGILRGMSLTLADAVAETATLGGWLGSRAANGVMNGFDEDDLMVLSSYGIPTAPVTRDTIMIEYADALFERKKLHGRRGVVQEGWELSVAVLVRLGDDGVSTRRIGEMLDRLPLGSDERIDRILQICSDYGMAREARSITERYADSIAETSDNYGTALIYYARAHCRRKVKDVLDLLVSLSLVQSAAFPPLSAVDPNLHSLIFSPKESLEQLALLDEGAAKMLHMNLTGYATLRRFYDLRDEEVNLEEGQTPRSGPIARKTTAAKALLAVISSAADNIHGGLYDESRGSVVQVDGLLALLGEAMVFVNQKRSVLSLSQCFTLLRAIEDLQTVTSRVYNQCEECFRSTLAAYRGNAAPASPRHLFKKTVSSMTSASSFSLVGSSMLDSAKSDGMGNSKAIVKPQGIKRGWDWRKGWDKDANGEDAKMEKVKGEDVLRVLRLGLAKDIARHWIEDAGA